MTWISRCSAARRSSSSGFPALAKVFLLSTQIRLLTPDSGAVLIDGADISHAGARELVRLRERFGFLQGAPCCGGCVGENGAAAA